MTLLMVCSKRAVKALQGLLCHKMVIKRIGWVEGCGESGGGEEGKYNQGCKGKGEIEVKLKT